jgi:pimeloyl-ACP methyl ester carboxylesterase
MTWILLRGLARETGHWGSFAGELLAGLGGDPVVMVDLPGNGARHRERTPLRVASIAEACRADVQRRNLPPPFDLFAVSMGAMVAIEWAHRYTNEIRRAVLVNASVRPYAPFHRRLRPQSYRALLSALFAADPSARENLVLRLTSGDIDANAGVVQDWVALARARPVARANVVRQLIAAARYCAPAKRPSCAVLLLASAHDRLVDVRCSRAIARHWDVPLVEHPRAGHDLPLDDPAWVIGRVRSWVNSLH